MPDIVITGMKGLERHGLLLIFLLAFGVRLLFALAWDPPLLYTHQYNYYSNALRIAEHPDPVGYVLRSDRWRAWVGGTTIAPLYYLLLGAFFKVVGPGLVPLRLFQAAVDALVAVATASLGRRLAGPAGLFAGVLYAVHWSSAEMTLWTMTENLHTILLAGSLVLMAREASRAVRSQGSTDVSDLFRGGLLLGLSGLTRSVSSAFVPVAFVWRALVGGLSRPALRRNLLPAAILLAGGLTPVLLWSARNRMLGDEVPIETVGFFNLWDDNTSRLVPRETRQEQLRALEAASDPDEYGRLAVRFTVANILGNPLGYLSKVSMFFWHLLRPEGVFNLLVKEYPDPPWRHVGIIVFDDLLLLVCVPLFGAFLLGAPPSPARRLVAWWTAYYLFMVVVVFHAEARYRSGLLPVFFAGAVAGLQAIRQTEPGRRRTRARAGLAAGLAVSLGAIASYAGPALAAWRSTRALASAEEALDSEALDADALDAARRITDHAAELAPTTARPWKTLGRWLAQRGRSEAALAAYDEAGRARHAVEWPVAAVRPRLLLDSARPEEAEAALRTAHLLSWNVDPWLMLEIAWRELPPPCTNEIAVGGLDYGAVRDFHHPRGIDPRLVAHRREIRRYDPSDGPVPPPGLHRWSRGTSWLRLRPVPSTSSGPTSSGPTSSGPTPTPSGAAPSSDIGAAPKRSAPRYTVILTMGSPFPSPRSNPEVEVRVNDGPAQRVRLDGEVRDYSFDAKVAPDGVLLVRLDAPTWGRLGEPADQGVRVERMRVESLSP